MPELTIFALSQMVLCDRFFSANAAAALEFYFLKNCEWDNILP